MNASLPIHQADTPFGRIEYLDLGHGRPVLVLHGTPGGHDQGALMAECLVRAGLRAIVPSRPGYLGSALTEANRSIDGSADALAALMAALGLPRYGVMSWSGGGPCSYRLALRQPGRVSALVALAALSQRYVAHSARDERFLFGTALGNWLLAQMRAHAPQALVGATLASEGELPKAELQALAAQVWADADKRRFVLGLTETISWRGPRQPGLHNDLQQFEAITDLGLPQMTVPVLVVHGKVDSDVPPTHGEWALTQIPGAQALWIERGGHLAPFTDPQATAIQARIAAFLDRD
ncbi:MAG: alpha/beta hydrolase [Burkholderiales bacterium]|nr:alpha/beta hydrolase [Burkholderiales bacterium]